MIDRKHELERIQYEQMEFLVKCAMFKKTGEQIDKIIYEQERLRRKVIR